MKWPKNYNCTVIVVDKWSVYDWTRTYLLCVPEASVYSSVSDQQQRDVGNHTEEWSAREQRLDFIHPLGHRTRTLKAWKKKFTFISVAWAVSYSRSACNTYLVKGHYIFFWSYVTLKEIIKTRNYSIPLKGCKHFCFCFSSGTTMEHIWFTFGYVYPVWC